MAAVYGIQLVTKLNCPRTRREYHPLRYDYCIQLLNSTPGTHPVYRPLTYDPRTKHATLLQVYPPLNAWTPSPSLRLDDWYYETWQTWIAERLATLSNVLRAEYPLTERASSLVNPIVFGAIVSRFLNSDSFDAFIPHLFFVPLQDTPVSAILKVPGQWSPDFVVRDGILTVPAGVKYIALGGYDPSDPTVPSTFGKHYGGYAQVKFYTDDSARTKALSDLRGGPPVLEHFDNPTYGSHLLVPLNGSLNGYGPLHVSQASLLMLESVYDCFRSNAIGGGATAVSRVDQCYHPVQNFAPGNQREMFSRLVNLALLVTQGAQLEMDTPPDPSMQIVSSILTRLMAEGDPQVWIPFRQDYKIIANISPFQPGLNPRYEIINVRMPFELGTYTPVPDASQPLRVLPQYRQATITLRAADAAKHDAELLPLAIDHGTMITGGLHFAKVDVTADAQPYPVRGLIDFPADYFAPPNQTRRELFSRLRAPADRSLLKDTAIFNFLATLVDVVTATPFLSPGYSLAYLGASSAHSSSDSPLIIDALQKGQIPGLPPIGRVAQFGYDVVHGAIADATQPLPTGTFSLVYSDLDQVEDGGFDLAEANRLAVSMTRVALQMTTMGGLTVVKVNFPTVNFWTGMFMRFATAAMQFFVAKPMIVNSAEIYLIFGGRTTVGRIHPTAALQRFLAEHFTRIASLDVAMEDVPLMGQPDDGLSALGIDSIRLFDPEFSDVRNTTGNAALAALLTATVPSSIYLTRQTIDGPVITTFYGKRTFLTAQRRLRLVSAPLPITRQITHQRRKTTSPLYKLFPGTPAPVTQLVAAGYNATMSDMWSRYAPLNILDLGTGPECRVIALSPHNVPLTMVDTRLPAEALHAFDPLLVSYLTQDYVSPAFWANRFADTVSAIFTLGTAAFASGQALVPFLNQLLPHIATAAPRYIWLQLNAPLGPIESIPGLIDIDEVANTYRFNKGERVEPYATPDALMAAVLGAFSNATLTWIALPPELSWLRYVIGLGTSFDLSDVSTALAYSRLTPILMIDTVNPPIRVVPPNPIVNDRLYLIINVGANTDRVSILQNGLEMATGANNNIQSIMGDAALQYNPALAAYELNITPSIAGVFEVSLEDANNVITPHGSFTVSTPPTDITVTMPLILDFSIAGNLAAIACHPYYQLAPFYLVDGTLTRVNPEKARVITGNGGRDLHFVFDLADNHVIMYLCDVDGTSIGTHIRYPLADIYNQVMPNNVMVRASLPYPGGKARIELGGVPFLDLANLPPVLPQNVTESQLSTAIDATLTTFDLPAGAYRYVLV
ncbi:VP1 [Marbled eel reovirus]|nr:VP1 [Marbled eel reovirus]